MTARPYLLFAIFTLFAIAAFAGATITTVSPATGPGDTQISVSGYAANPPVYVEYAGAGATTCPATISPSSPPPPCTGVQLEDNPSICQIGTGGSGGTSGPAFTETVTGCVGTAASYTFCSYNWNGDSFVAPASYTNTGGLGSCTSGWLGPAGIVTSQICSIYNGVKTAVFVLGLLLMILGGAIYAGSVILPGSTKGTLQGYAMSMLIGGVIGVIIALVSPYILGIIIGSTPTC